MALTKAELRNKVLRHLSMLPEGQTADAHLTDVVEKAIDQSHAFLEAEGIAYWATSAIPDGVAIPLARYVGSQVAPELMEPDRAGAYVSAELASLIALRRFTAKPNATVSAVYY